MFSFSASLSSKVLSNVIFPSSLLIVVCASCMTAKIGFAAPQEARQGSTICKIQQNHELVFYLLSRINKFLKYDLVHLQVSAGITTSPTTAQCNLINQNDQDIVARGKEGQPQPRKNLRQTGDNLDSLKIQIANPKLHSIQKPL